MIALKRWRLILPPRCPCPHKILLQKPQKQKTKAFHALKEKCTLSEDTLFSFRDRFQFPNETRVHLPRSGEKACTFAHGKVCFYKVAFLSGLRFPVHPFITKPIHHLDITPGKLMPNSWRIILSCIKIWMTVNDRDMIRLDEFVHLYHLKEWQELRYYEFVPWDRKARLIIELPLPFRYWKSIYFFVFGGGSETPFDNLWGDVPRLLRRWKTQNLVHHFLQEIF